MKVSVLQFVVQRLYVSLVFSLSHCALAHSILIVLAYVSFVAVSVYWCMHRTSLLQLCCVPWPIWYVIETSLKILVCVFFPRFLFCLTLLYCCVMNLAPPIQSYISCQQHVWRVVWGRLTASYLLYSESYRCGAALNAAAVHSLFEFSKSDAWIRGERHWTLFNFSMRWVCGRSWRENKHNLIFHVWKSLFHSPHIYNRFSRNERRKFHCVNQCDGMNNNQIMKSFSNYIE